MNSYELSRTWFNWCFDNPDKSKPIHTAIYFFAIEHCNRLGWKEKFGFPSQMVMEALGIKNWRTYSKALNELVQFGFINMIEISKNQYSSNIIAIVKNTKATTKALDKALHNHSTKQGQSIVSINKQITSNKEQDNNIDWSKLLSKFNDITGKSSRVVPDKAKRQILARIKEGYTKQDILKGIENCYKDSHHQETNHKYLTLEFISRPDKLEKFVNVTPIAQKKAPQYKDDWR